MNNKIVNKENIILDAKTNRSRGDNWTQEEKDLCMEIKQESAPVIENKDTNTNTNKKKNLEWLTIQNNANKAYICSTNIKIKKQAMEYMKREHKLKIKYHKQELRHQKLRHKLEIDLLMLEKEKKLLEIKALKKTD